MTQGKYAAPDPIEPNTAGDPVGYLDAGTITGGYLDASLVKVNGTTVAELHGNQVTLVATQSEHPYRAVARTIFAGLIGLAAAWALIIEALGLDKGLPWVATTLAIAGGITRVLAIPAVNTWLQTFIPWLAATPKILPADKDEEPADAGQGTDLE